MKSSVMSYEQNIIFYGQNLKLTKNDTFNNLLYNIEFFVTIASHQFLKKRLDFDKSLFFPKKYSLLFLILKLSQKPSNIVI